MMKKVNQRFEGETYSCRYCGKENTRDDVEEWKCIHCNNRVLIKTKDNKYLVRKQPTEIENHESILLRGTGLYHEILSVVDIDYVNNKCSLNLRGHGNQKFNDEWINVMWNDNEIVD
ncbi:hypothetical protein [Paenisporosarcina indica]|uniref:hypothetical protein n=1 Tax=Paenisporosarcina indica TaxID=650093 RepID=UPI00094F5B30|nr:hypothetical protein [Paenisporosarcina indica]